MTKAGKLLLEIHRNTRLQAIVSKNLPRQLPWSFRLLVETQTIMMASNMIVYFIYFSGCVSTVVTGIAHEHNCDLMIAHVDVLETTP